MNLKDLWGYQLNRKKFAVLFLLILVLQTFTMHGFVGYGSTYGLIILVLLLSLLLIAKLRCNHIGLSTGKTIGVLVVMMIPLLCLASMGYLAFKRGLSADEVGNHAM